MSKTNRNKYEEQERKKANKAINSLEIQSTTDTSPSSSTLVPISSGFTNQATESSSIKIESQKITPIDSRKIR